MRVYLSLCLFLFVLSGCASKQSVDLLVRNARIYTLDAHFDTASVLVINQGLVKAVGGDELLAQYKGRQEVDAGRQFIYPGFIDAHCHFTGYALDAYKLKLFDVTSFDSLVSRVVAFGKTTKRPWIEGHGWDEHRWAVQEFPDKDTLDKLFPDRPVFLLRIDGHAALVNQAALDLAHIDAGTRIPGGEIVSRNGKLTGILIDKAMEAVKHYIPEMQEEEAIGAIAATQQDFFTLGLTGLVECGVNKPIIEWLQRAYQEKKLSLRSTMMLNYNPENLAVFLHRKPYRDDQLHVAGFKVFADGSLGSRGANLLSDYSDRPHHKGSFMLDEDTLKQFLALLTPGEYQCCVHAIGDAANQKILHLYAHELRGKNDRRWRIEHAQVVDPADLRYFREYNIIPSVQPTHATSDMQWAGERLGSQRMKGAYAYQQLLQTNGWLPLGTDFPVEKLNPLYTFYAAVFRTDSSGNPPGGFQPENALTREEALRGMTIWAARSVFEDDRKGSLEAGKYADFVILDTDLMKAGAKDIYHARVLSTYLGGKCVYSAAEAGK